MNPVAKAALDAMVAVDDIELAEAIRSIDDAALCVLVRENETLRIAVGIQLLLNEAFEEDEPLAAEIKSAPAEPRHDDWGDAHRELKPDNVPQPSNPPAVPRPTEALRAETAQRDIKPASNPPAPKGEAPKSDAPKGEATVLSALPLRDAVLAALRTAASAGLSRRQLVVRTRSSRDTILLLLRELREEGLARCAARRWYFVPPVPLKSEPVRLVAVPVEELTSPTQHFKCVPYDATITGKFCLDRQADEQGDYFKRLDGKRLPRTSSDSRAQNTGRAHAKCRDCALGRAVAERVGGS